MSEPVLPADTKDWTWVLERPCPECGYDARSVRHAELKNRLLANASAWRRVLGEPDVAVRTRPDRWSVLEYACHVRDVHRIFGERLRLMLSVDDPLFANWDQDEAAVEGAYGSEDPAAVAGALDEVAAAVAAGYADVRDAQWERPGRRSNGSVFTADTLARYHLHDVEHHLHDVAG